MRIALFILTGLALLSSAAAQAQSAPSAADAATGPQSGLLHDAEKGWFFYEEPPAPLPPIKPLPNSILAPSKPREPKSARCAKENTWTVDCGFVDPGKSFLFQSKERDALMRSMVMNQNDPKAVEQFQYYMRWVVHRSIEVANLWQYNMVQNPVLDPTVKAPISTFGLRLMTQVRDANAASILGALKTQGAFLVYFTRSDCDYCEAMVPVVQQLQQATALQVWDLSLDQDCESAYAAHCKTGPAILKAAEALRVSLVPTIFLYVPGGSPSTDAWIRIATGVSDVSTMKGRVVSFFTAYRTALLKGVHNGYHGQAPVDFSDAAAPAGLAQGVPSGDADKSAALPTGAQIKALLSQTP